MTLFRYTSFGVSFGSDVPLSLPPANDGDLLRFRLCESQGDWPASNAGLVLQEDGDEWTLLRVYQSGFVEMEWKDWLRFWIDPTGETVSYRVKEERYPTAFEAYVANFAMSACLMLQGEEMLHSTVISFRGSVVGFLGDSGAGKSTFTAYLLGLGADLVTDDMLRLTEAGSEMYAEPGPPRLKLFESTAKRHLPWLVNKGRWNPVSEKYLFDTGEQTIVRPRVPLDYLVLLTYPLDGSSGAITVRKLEGLELFQTFTASTMSFRMQTRERLARQFAFANRLAQKIPVYALHYPRRHDIFTEAWRHLGKHILEKGGTN